MTGKVGAWDPARIECEPMHPDEDGWSEWIHPLPGYLMQCCGCKLIHEMQVAISARNGDKSFPANDGEDDHHLVVFRMRRACDDSGGLAAENRDKSQISREVNHSPPADARTDALREMIRLDEEMGLYDDSAAITQPKASQ